MWDLSFPEIEPAPHALQARSLYHWTTKEVPTVILFLIFQGASILFSSQWLHDFTPPQCTSGFPGSLMVKNPPANAGDARVMGSIPGFGKLPGGGNDNPFQ